MDYKKKMNFTNKWAELRIANISINQSSLISLIESKISVDYESKFQTASSVKLQKLKWSDQIHGLNGKLMFMVNQSIRNWTKF